MARRGFGGMNALRAALGAATGVAEGLQQRDLLAEQRKKEADVLARQKEMDARALAVQLAGLQAQGWKGMDEIAPQQQEARKAINNLVNSAMSAASGGTPLQAPSKAGMEALSQGYAAPKRSITLGGKTLTLTETDDEMRARLAREARDMAKADTQAERDRAKALVVAARKAGRNSPEASELLAVNPEAYKIAFPEPRGGGGGGRAALSRQDELDEAEAWFNTPEPDAARRKMIAQTFNNLRKAKGNENRSARELIKATYDAVMARDASQYKQAQTGRIEAQTNPGGLGSIFPGVQVPTNNAQIEEERKAFDDAVAEYGMQYVLSQGYRRP